MNPSSLFDMKHSIVRAVADYVDIEAEELVEVRHTCHALTQKSPPSPSTGCTDDAKKQDSWSSPGPGAACLERTPSC